MLSLRIDVELCVKTGIYQCAVESESVAHLLLKSAKDISSCGSAPFVFLLYVTAATLIDQSAGGTYIDMRCCLQTGATLVMRSRNTPFVASATVSQWSIVFLLNKRADGVAEMCVLPPHLHKDAPE